MSWRAVAGKVGLIAVLVASLASLSAAQRGGGGRPAPAPRAPIAPAVRQPQNNVSPFSTGDNAGPNFAKSDSRPLKFSASVQMVLVPAVVTDKSGRHVTGLTKDDFTLREDGKEQKIASFEEIHAGAAPVPRSAAPANEFSNVTVGDQVPRRFTIIALDTVNTPFLDQARAREALVKYLAQTVSEGQPVMLCTIGRSGIKVIHDFTTNPEVLRAALQKVHGELPPTASAPGAADAASVDAKTFASQGVNAEADQLLSFIEGMDQSAGFEQATSVATTLEAFQYIAEAFAGIPGRKSLIWVTGSFPFNIDTDTSALLGSGSPSALYERTFQMLNNANIAVYPVDARGLVDVGLPDASVRSSHANVANPAVVIQNALSTHMDTIATLEQVAAMTGGRAFYNRNDLEGAFREAADDSSDYYLIGYYLDKTNTKAGWRKLAVKAHREGAHVRAREGFFLTRTLMDPTQTHDMDLYVALQSPLDYSALPVTVRIANVQSQGDRRRVRFEIVLPANAASIDDSDGNHLSLDFAAVARDGKGDGKAVFTQTFSSKLKPGGVQEIRESGITYTNSLDLPPGEYSVRVVVRDNLNGRMGSVLAPLKVM